MILSCKATPTHIHLYLVLKRREAFCHSIEIRNSILINDHKIYSWKKESTLSCTGQPLPKWTVGIVQNCWYAQDMGNLPLHIETVWVVGPEKEGG